MLGKLIKYEFKATSRFILLLYGLLLMISVLMSVTFRFNRGDSGVFNIGIGFSRFFLGGGIVIETLAVFMTIAYVILNIAAVSVMFFYSINRFRQNILGDEGYLMHTLPVKARDNILAKNIVSVVWTAIGFATAVISWIIISLGSYGTMLFSEISQFFRIVTNGRAILICSELVVLAVITLMKDYFRIYASMAAGYSLNKNRAAASVGIFVILSIIQSVFHSLLMQILTINTMPTVHLALLVEIIFTSAVCLGFYFITKYFISRRLNLQ